MTKAGKTRERLEIPSIRGFADYMHCLLNWPKKNRPRSFKEVYDAAVRMVAAERGDTIKANTLKNQVSEFINYHLLHHGEELFAGRHNVVPSPKAVALYHAARRIAEDYRFISTGKVCGNAELRIATHNRFARNQMPYCINAFDTKWAQHRVKEINKYDQDQRDVRKSWLEEQADINKEEKQIIKAKWSATDEHCKQMMWPERVDCLVQECDNDTVHDIKERTRRGEVHFGLGTVPDNAQQTDDVDATDFYCSDLPQLAVIRKDKLLAKDELGKDIPDNIQIRCKQGKPLCVSAVEWYAKNYLQDWLDGKSPCLLRGCPLTDSPRFKNVQLNALAGRRILVHDDATVMRYVEAGIADVGIVAYLLHPEASEFPEESDIPAMKAQTENLEWLLVELDGVPLRRRRLGVWRRVDSQSRKALPLPEYARVFLEVLLQKELIDKFEAAGKKLDGFSPGSA